MKSTKYHYTVVCKKWNEFAYLNGLSVKNIEKYSNEDKISSAIDPNINNVNEVAGETKDIEGWE